MDTQKFENNLFQLEVKTEKGEALFDVETVARSLGFTQTKSGKKYIRWETVNKYLRKYLSQEVGKNDFISEPMVYKLAFKANNALAEKFQDWLATEVLPQIRKYGMYAKDELLDDPDLLLDVITKYKEERTLRLMAEQQVLELQPRATYYDLVIQNKSLLSVTKIAKDYGLSARKLNSLLHEFGVQFKQGDMWFLYQDYADKGYTQSFTHVIDDEKSKMSTKWTQKGRLFIYEIMKQNGWLPLIEQN
ncbi:phage antirepressor KilAC domain-containing protein [Enterococcus faecalis]|uniref:phage antirepressor KilAC domain-containing protein n=1 Tax=Enterococcus faecalis TaxID=1351 RepID=UPI0017844B77|nr:phage antirepressor KilAC domain-containing protein [Enterococcus faecalis]MBD9845945.1 phage antirepressor KilAC domain-containing protein [Enterococcus faecalis]